MVNCLSLSIKIEHMHTGNPCFTLLLFITHCRYCLFYKLKVCGNFMSRKSIGTVFPTAFVFLSLCHILVILTVFQTFFFLFFFFFKFNFIFYTLHNCISLAKYQNESATGIHVFPILHPPPSSLPIPSLWVVPVHQPQASSIVHRTWTGNSFHT